MTNQFEFSAEDFAYLQCLGAEYLGITLHETKQMLVYNRLVKRLRALDLPNFKTYCEILKAGDATEHQYFIDAITTTVTSFFRENHSFQYLQEKILPALFHNKRTKILRVWSAGCSSGQEAYSIAIAVKEVISRDWLVEILATDINLNALATAKLGVYPQESIAEISAERKKRWFLKGKNDKAGYVQIKPELRRMIHFKELNLMDTWSLPRFDVVFCRNVVIYFSKDIQCKLFDKFADSLEPKGKIIVGHSESLHNISKRLQHIQNNVYEKIA